MGTVVSLSAYRAARAQVAPPTAEVVPLATMQHRWLPAPMPWLNARVMVKTNFTWGTCRYIDAVTGRLVIEQTFNGQQVYRTFADKELRHPQDRGPKGAA